MVCQSENVVIVVMGNELRGDDNAGLLFGNLIKKHTSIPVISGGDAPENVTGYIVKKCPDTILLVDAMDFGGRPGEVSMVSSKKLRKDNISTHGSLRLFVEYLEKMTGARILVLGFQPKNLGLGEQMSPEVAECVRKTARNFKSTDGLSQILNSLRKE